MAPPAPYARQIVIRARFETIVLVVATTAMTLALSGVVHSRRLADRDNAPQPVAVADQTWAGDLADVSSPSPPNSIEPLTSASLVVPKSVLALPSVIVRPLVKLRGCEGSVCAAKVVPTPARRPAADVAALSRRAGPQREKPTLIARLNPLRHLPDMRTIGRPFAYAGNAVSGWFSSF